MSLFLRSYLVIGISLFLAFFAILIVIDSSFETEDRRLFLTTTKVESNLALLFLAKQESPPTADSLSRYRTSLDIDIQLVRPELIEYQLGIDLSLVSADGYSETPAWFSWLAIYPVPNSNWYLLLQEADTPLTQGDWLQITLPLLTILLVVGLGLFLLSLRVQQHLAKLRATTIAIGDGNWSVRANTNLPEPIKGMARSINSMAAQLERKNHDQQIAVGAVPHEIRTPVARMRFALDMSKQANTATELRQHIERVDGYLDDLQTTINATLNLIRTGQAKMPLNDAFDAFLLKEELRQHAAARKSEAGSPRLSFTLNEISQQPHYCNFQLIKQAASNILDNALLYGRNEVQVNISTVTDRVVIQIDDDGEGIAPDELDHVFSPFYRADESRTRSTGGVGLGLALVRLIMVRHQGNAWAEANPRGGARFTLRW